MQVLALVLVEVLALAREPVPVQVLALVLVEVLALELIAVLTLEWVWAERVCRFL